MLASVEQALEVVMAHALKDSGRRPADITGGEDWQPTALLGEWISRSDASGSGEGNGEGDGEGGGEGNGEDAGEGAGEGGGEGTGAGGLPDALAAALLSRLRASAGRAGRECDLHLQQAFLRALAQSAHKADIIGGLLRAHPLELSVAVSKSLAASLAELDPSPSPSILQQRIQAQRAALLTCAKMFEGDADLTPPSWPTLAIACNVMAGGAVDASVDPPVLISPAAAVMGLLCCLSAASAALRGLDHTDIGDPILSRRGLGDHLRLRVTISASTAERQRAAQEALQSIDALTFCRAMGAQPHPTDPGFAVEEETPAAAMAFGKPSQLFSGLVGMIGPDPATELAAGAAASASGPTVGRMREEHCERLDSQRLFTTSNYHVETTSEQEWAFVVDPVSMGWEAGAAEPCWPVDRKLRDAPNDRAKCRVPKPMEAFAVARAEVDARLAVMETDSLGDDEFFGARLYTGPMCASASSPAFIPPSISIPP